MFGLGGKKEEKKEDEEEEKNEEEKPEENAEGEEGEGGEEGEEEVLQVAKTRKINREQFFKEVSERANPPPRGDTEQERDHWSRPRRWQVRLWQVRIENMTDEAILVFGNFIFGGTKEEFLVRNGGKEPSIWVAGDEGMILRTPVVHDIPGDGEDTECDFDVSFEWLGSYLDLERQTLRLEIWNWARWRINKFDCFAEESLLTFAKGPIQNEMECNKVDKFGKKQCRVQVSFKLFFQEIYDFELTMPVWRASGVPTCKRLLERLRDNIEEDEEDLVAGARGTLGRSTRQTGNKPELARAASMTSEELTQQTIRIRTPALLAHGTRSHCLASSKCGNSSGSVLWDTWSRKKFRGYFRGTCSDLSNAALEVDLMSYERPRELQGFVNELGGGRPSGGRAFVSLANAEISLRGVLEHGEVKANLRPAPWFYGLQEGGKVHRQRCGLLQGHVAVDNRPRYQQTDDVSDELDLRKRYLFVKVIKVDRVVTPDTRPTDEIDTFVEVTFDGVSKRTRICQDDVSPSFNDDLVFELNLAKTSSSNERQEDNEATWEELERKGPVFIDLWTVGAKSNEHLGSVEAFLQDILTDDVGQPQKEVSRSARDARLKRQETFSVRAFRGQRRLNFTWGPGQESNIFYEMWFLPDLQPLAVLKALPAEVPLPKALAEKFDEKMDNWCAMSDELNGIAESMEQIEQDEKRENGRQFRSTAKSIWPVQSAQEHFLPRFCDVLRPPHGIDSATAVCHYVGCFPYMESKAEDTVSTPNFFCALRKGKVLEHALLHCSLLLGLSFKAYVCCGRNLKNEEHAWVAVFEEDGTVRFWEPFLGTGTLQLRKRFAHPQFLLPGKPCRSLKEVDVKAEERRRRRMLLQMRGKDLKPVVLKGDPAAAKAPSVKKSIFRPTKRATARATRVPEDVDTAHEHDMVYVDLLDLGLKTRGDEDRNEHAAMHCAGCYAVLSGSYFYRGYACPSCQQANQRYLLCLKCAEPLFEDEEALDDIDYDPKQRFDFEAYNHHLGASDSSTILPYKSIEVVFNNSNIWMNKQDPDPRYIFWDLQNKDYWHPFASKVSGLRPCFSTCRFPMAGRDDGWSLRERRELLQELRKVIQMHRSHRNLGTRWVTSPQLLRFLEAGLRIRAQLEMEGQIIEDEEQESTGRHELLQQLGEWEKTLNAKTPREYKLSSMPMHFNYLDGEEIAEKVIELCPFLMTRDKSAQLALACHLVPLPGEVVSIYLFACELHAMGQMQLREEKERQLAPKADQGQTVAQLLRNFGKGFKKNEEKGQSLATMIIEAAKKAKGLAAAVVEPIRELEEGQAAAKGDEVIALTGFRASFRSRYVRISEDGLEATYVGTKDEEAYAMQGGLMGNGPLELHSEGKYFEIEVTRTTGGHLDGLCLGVTQTAEARSVPETMEGLLNTWIAGYDGLFWDPKEADMLPIAWNPASLQNGDIVGLLIRPAGTFVLFVNDKIVLEREAAVPMDAPLFPVVDLLGSCDAVRLRLNASPPAPKAGEAVAVPELMSGFSTTKGHYVELSKDCRSASYSGQTGCEMYGGLIGDAPLPKLAAGLYFSVQLTMRREEMTDGLTLGLTLKGPRDLDEMPETIDGVQACWTVGYDGQMYNSQEDRWTDLAWHGRDLKVGDVVTLLADEAGQMKIFVNDRLKCLAHAGIPCEKPLYALVDLLGSAAGVRLVERPPPPDQGLETVVAVEPPVSLKSTMEGWCATRYGRHVEISPDARSARYASTYQLHGGLLGDGPLRSFSNGWSFAVRVDSTRQGQDGLALGVTTCPPSLFKELPQTMDEVDPCWLMGFDGVEWDGAKLMWGPAKWNPLTLKVGDVVAVLVTLQGEFQISVNGVAVAQASFTLPTERPLYAVVDLIGATNGITLVDMEPPTSGGPALVFQPPVLRGDPFTAPSEAGDLAAPEDVEFDSPPASPEAPGAVEVIPEVTVVVTKAPETPAPLEEAPKSPRDGAIGAVLAAQALATETGAPKRSGPKRKPVKGAKKDGSAGAKPKVAQSVEEPPAKLAFHPSKHGKFVTISHDGLFAKHDSSFEGDMFGGVLGSTPLKKESHGFYFEVRIEEAVTGNPDGLAIGVTTDEPQQVKQIPEILDSLKQAWLVGFDGIIFDGQDFREVDWYPSELRIGDRVGVLVTPAGQLQIFVNGKFRLDGPDNVDTGKPLYLAVDLIGNTEAVSLLPEAVCPLTSNTTSRTTARGFHRQSLGRQLRLLGDWTVEHMGKEELQGTALGACPLDEHRYFEVHIDEVVEGKPDGMAIGVTSHRPDEINEPPGTSDALRPSWLAGFDGAVWDGAKMEWLLSTWDTRQLRAGDDVGALVDSQGQLRIFVNGQVVAKGPTIPSHAQALYPVVDLLGAVRRLSLKPVATAPTMPEPLHVAVSHMSCFHRHKVGAQILLSEDATGAQRASYAESSLEGGLLFGDGPLEAREDGAVGYLLRVTEAAKDSEGLALGFTSRPPDDLEQLPFTADEVENSYLLGFDGAAWDGSALKWHFSHWQPHTLQVDDQVEVVLTKQRLQVAVNGTRVAAQAMQVSSPGPFYALIDLASAGMGVSLLDTSPSLGGRSAGEKDAMHVCLPNTS